MSVTRIPTALRRFVIERAGECCEYCLPPTAVAFFPHEVDHIIAEKHGGTTLYHPRTQHWQQHFAFDGVQIEGLTAEGRTTVWLLQLNSPERITERRTLLESGKPLKPRQDSV